MPEFYLPIPENPDLTWAHGGLERWVVNGIKPGDFLCALLRNDLKGAFDRADERSVRNLRELVMYCYRHLPTACWGSAELFDAWKGIEAKADAQA